MFIQLTMFKKPAVHFVNFSFFTYHPTVMCTLETLEETKEQIGIKEKIETTYKRKCNKKAITKSCMPGDNTVTYNHGYKVIVSFSSRH